MRLDSFKPVGSLPAIAGDTLSIKNNDESIISSVIDEIVKHGYFGTQFKCIKRSHLKAIIIAAVSDLTTF